MAARRPYRRPVNHPSRSRGFSLLEALIAVLVISVGLLGASGLQLLSLRSTNQGLLRSQATTVAGDMAERIRANPLAVAGGHFAALSSTVLNCAEPPKNCAAAAVNCNAGELASFDFFAGACRGAAQLLPGGELSVSCATSAGGDPLCAISVSWLEQAQAEGEAPARQQVNVRIQP